VGRRCRHRHARMVAAILVTERDGVLKGNGVETRWCPKCDQRVAIGPSNDEPETVRIEMRAAEIVTALEHDDGCEMTPFECSGFNDEPMTLRGGGRLIIENASTRAGYLAHTIATHDDARLGGGR
jgi:hypothetical protein